MATRDMMNFPGCRTGAMRCIMGLLICAGAMQLIGEMQSGTDVRHAWTD